MNTVVDFVRNGMGIAMVPYYVIGEERDLYVKEIEKFSDEFICIAVRDYQQEPEFLREFVDLVKKYSKEKTS
jgi:DNA-binding transcriptional LysR family regulator